MASEEIGFAKVMRFCNTLAEFESFRANNDSADELFVIVLQDKLIKFKGQTFDMNGGSGSVDCIPLIRDFSDDFNNDFSR